MSKWEVFSGPYFQTFHAVEHVNNLPAGSHYILLIPDKGPIVWKVPVCGVLLVRIFPHSDWTFIRIPESTDKKNSEYGHYLRSDCVQITILILSEFKENHELLFLLKSSENRSLRNKS